MVKLRRLTAVTLSAALVAAGALLTAPAASAGPAFHEVGLYGTSDPTYDGVYRQSLAILGLRVAGRTPAPEAVHWLLSQQCPDGGFSSYKTTVACPAFNSSTFTGGRDSNATAMAIAALKAVGTTASIAAATKAATYLRGVQQADGGWEFYPGQGQGTDPNSTGLVLLALTSAGLTPANPTATVAAYYQGLQSGPGNGGIATPWATSAADDFSTVQSIPGLAGLDLTHVAAVSGPWQLDAPAAPALPATTGSAQATWAASWLAPHLGSASTYALDHPAWAAWAVLGLSSVRAGKTLAQGLETALVGLPSNPSPAANGQYALAAATVGDAAALSTYADRIAASLTRDVTAPTAHWSAPGTTAPTARVVTLTRTTLSDGYWPASRLRTVITWGDGTRTIVAPRTTSVTHTYAAAGRHAIAITVTDPSGNVSRRTDVTAPRTHVDTPTRAASRASWQPITVHATDVGSGVRAVRVRIAQVRHGAWVSWNGARWVAGLGGWVYAAHVTATNRWIVHTPALTLGRLSVAAVAVDRTGLVGPRSQALTTLVR